MNTVDVGALAGSPVLDADGRTRLLGGYWAVRPAVLVWLRHFGCLFCKEQAAEMRLVRAPIEALGGRLVFIGHGGADIARDFRDRHVPGCTVLTDPAGETYRSIGASESAIGTIAGFGIHGVRAMAKGHVQTRILGRAFQNGGVLIVTPENAAAWTYVSRVAGDHPSGETVVAALRGVLAGEVVTPRYDPLPAGLADPAPEPLPWGAGEPLRVFRWSPPAPGAPAWPQWESPVAEASEA